ncbi:hypothetical protein evm_003919 [Chilo suppressalis]|nr:hypothetical protein evm_003919 [Chilo suppressalis]
MIKDILMHGLNHTDNDIFETCETRISGKLSGAPFPKSENTRTTEPLTIIHSDSDNRKEYRNKEFYNFLKANGIQKRLTAAYTPQQNGVSERINRSLLERARCLLSEANAPKKLWAEAIATANYLMNRSPSIALNGDLPFKMGRALTVRKSPARVRQKNFCFEEEQKRGGAFGESSKVNKVVRARLHLRCLMGIHFKSDRKRCDEQLGDSQFGFRSGVGTREALFAVQVLIQKCLDMQQDVYLCFIDYEKAFDRVRHDRLIKILNDVGLDNKDIRIIKNLYWNQRATVRIEGEETEEVEIKRGVRQGCSLSPTLFNLYSEAIMAEALEDLDCGVIINGRRINNLRYADDTVLLASTEADLQQIVNRVNECSLRAGLKMNITKTKCMVISRNTHLEPYIAVSGQTIERVRKYKYLGTWLTESWDSELEIKTRIEIARNAFKNMSKVLCNRNLKITLRTRLLLCYVWPILLYGCESWTIKEDLRKRIEAFEMWCYRHMSAVLTRCRVSPEQLDILLNFMEDHPDFAAGKQSIYSRFSSSKLWRLLAERLNAAAADSSGARKSPDKWCRYWADIKYKARRKSAAGGALGGLSSAEERLQNILRNSGRDSGGRGGGSDEERRACDDDMCSETSGAGPGMGPGVGPGAGGTPTDELLAEAAMRTALAAEKQAEAVAQAVDLLRDLVQVRAPYTTRAAGRGTIPLNFKGEWQGAMGVLYRYTTVMFGNEIYTFDG